MDKPMKDFLKLQTNLYRTDAPGYYAAFALWKMEKLCGEAKLFYLPGYDCYYVVRNKHLLIYYAPDGKCHIPDDVLNGFECINMDAGMFDTIKDRLTGFNINYSENLRYDKNYIPPDITTDDFEIAEFDFSNGKHYEAAAQCINGTDGFTGKSGEFTAAHIKRIEANYKTCGVFDPFLWFFVRDRRTDKLIGGAISTYQESVKETLLDWIHILPAYQGKGAGRFMIQEIIRRSLDRSDIIQVGGTVAFYKKCGFYTHRTDVWAPKPGYNFHAPSICP